MKKSITLLLSSAFILAGCSDKVEDVSSNFSSGSSELMSEEGVVTLENTPSSIEIEKLSMDVKDVDNNSEVKKDKKPEKVVNDNKADQTSVQSSSSSGSAKSTASITFIEGDEPVILKQKPKEKLPIITQDISGDFISDEKINVRSNFKLDSSIIASIESRTKITVTKQAHDGDITWYNIIINGKEGWLPSSKLVAY